LDKVLTSFSTQRWIGFSEDDGDIAEGLTVEGSDGKFSGNAALV